MAQQSTERIERIEVGHLGLAADAVVHLVDVAALDVVLQPGDVGQVVVPGCIAAPVDGPG